MDKYTKWTLVIIFILSLVPTVPLIHNGLSYSTGDTRIITQSIDGWPDVVGGGSPLTNIGLRVMYLTSLPVIVCIAILDFFAVAFLMIILKLLINLREKDIKQQFFKFLGFIGLGLGSICYFLFTDGWYFNHWLMGVALSYMLLSIGFGLLFIYYKRSPWLLFLSLLLHPYTGILIFILSFEWYGSIKNKLIYYETVALAVCIYIVYLYFFTTGSLNYLILDFHTNGFNESLITILPVLFSYISIKALHGLKFKWIEAGLVALMMPLLLMNNQWTAKLYLTVCPLLILISHIENIDSYKINGWRYIYIAISLITLAINILVYIKM